MKHILISLASFFFGGYMLYVCITIIVKMNSSTPPEGYHGFAPSYLPSENLKVFLFTIIGTIAGFINGIWYFININSLDDFDQNQEEQTK